MLGVGGASNCSERRKWTVHYRLNGAATPIVVTVLLTGLYGMSFDLSDMERGEIHHDRYMNLLLADCMQDIGAAKPNAEKAMYRLGTYSRGV